MSLGKNADKVTLRAVSDLLTHGVLLFPFRYGIHLLKKLVCLSCRILHIFHFCPFISIVIEYVPLTSTSCQLVALTRDLIRFRFRFFTRMSHKWWYPLPIAPFCGIRIDG